MTPPELVEIANLRGLQWAPHADGHESRHRLQGTKHSHDNPHEQTVKLRANDFKLSSRVNSCRILSSIIAVSTANSASRSLSPSWSPFRPWAPFPDGTHRIRLSGTPPTVWTAITEVARLITGATPPVVAVVDTVLFIITIKPLRQSQSP